MTGIDDPAEVTSMQGLLARVRAGDADAFCQLIEPLQGRLLGQAKGLCADLALAEDLVAETLVEAWKSFSRFNGSCRLSTWLYSILLHRYYKAVRHARCRPVPFSGMPSHEAEAMELHQANLPAPESTPAEAAASQEESDRIRRCIAALPEKHRSIVLLRFFEGASLQDMAVILNCSVGTVKSRLHHALEKMRKMKMNFSTSQEDKLV